MSEPTNIRLLKSGNLLLIEPSTDKIKSIVCPALVFTTREFLFGYQKRMAGKQIQIDEHQMYALDYRGRVVTNFGFYRRVTGLLREYGYNVRVLDIEPPEDPTIFEPQWDLLFSQSRIEVRDEQLEDISTLLAHPCGRADLATGYGKSVMIGIIARILPRAKIDVVSRQASVLRDRLYPELAQMLPDVGMVGAGKQKYGSRVMLWSAKSLHKNNFTADIVLADECHQLAADELSEKMGRYTHSRCYGFSASHDKRPDGKDYRVEAMFGPLIVQRSYQEVQASGRIAPILVRWRDVVLDYNPCFDKEDVEKKRYGIWANDGRNALIAADARLYDEDTQVLITTETLEHAIYLRNLLPDFELVYAANGLSTRDRAWYVDHGLLPEDEPHMTHARQIWLAQQFEASELKKAICTPVWNVGVDFPDLRVLIRADGGGSPVNDIQIPGRVARVSDGKERGVLHDYMDQFDRGFRQKAGRRFKSYAELGWEQETVDGRPLYPQGQGGGG